MARPGTLTALGACPCLLGRQLQHPPVAVEPIRLGLSVQIVENDHLRHRGLYQAVSADMAERWTGNGVSLLDLGCGGAGRLPTVCTL